MVSAVSPLDPPYQAAWRALKDKTHEKWVAGGKSLEQAIYETKANENDEMMAAIIARLETDYIQGQSNRYIICGGFIGMAAVTFALGPRAGHHLKKIVPPVLSRFTHQDNLIRYYACESIYNIAKIVRGEIMIYFHSIFDALSKLVADSDQAVKNAADLLNPLVRDIVSESATAYVTTFEDGGISSAGAGDDDDLDGNSAGHHMPFSLPKFIPYLEERFQVENPQTRNFLITWIILLNSIPGLDFVTYLSTFLGALFRYLDDPNDEVQQNTASALDQFLTEIKKIASVQRGLAGSDNRQYHQGSVSTRFEECRSDAGETGNSHVFPDDASTNGNSSNFGVLSYNDQDEDFLDQEEWIPGQNIDIDYLHILGILSNFLVNPVERTALVALHWIDEFFEISPQAMVEFFPKLLGLILPALAHRSEAVSQQAAKINATLTEFIAAIPEQPSEPKQPVADGSPSIGAPEPTSGRANRNSHKDTSLLTVVPGADTSKPGVDASVESVASPSQPPPEYYQIDYDAAVHELSIALLAKSESTKVSAIEWLIRLHQKSPTKTLALNESIASVLLKTLSDSSEVVVTRDLLLLSQISQISPDDYFNSFITNLLQLFSTDRRLLETRGNLIIRQLCITLMPDQIYLALADKLKQDQDLEFVGAMVQNLNSILMTAPELHLLRIRLRSLDTPEGQTLFVTLFKPWCHNPVSLFSLCLLAQAYEQAYQLLTVFGEIEMTVEMLIQIDKLVQLIESPVFTYLRLQLLELEKHPFLHKSLYGLLMLLPQSSAFYALRNRLQSVSGIGYLSLEPQLGKGGGAGAGGSSARTAPGQVAASVSGFDRPSRVRARDENGAGAVPWTALINKFREVQEQNRQKNCPIENSPYHSSTAFATPGNRGLRPLEVGVKRGGGPRGGNPGSGPRGRTSGDASGLAVPPAVRTGIGGGGSGALASGSSLPKPGPSLSPAAGTLDTKTVVDSSISPGYDGSGGLGVSSRTQVPSGRVRNPAGRAAKDQKTGS